MSSILLEVFCSSSGVITVISNSPIGGTRLCGTKLFAGNSRKIADFWLTREAVTALADDLAMIEESESASAPERKQKARKVSVLACRREHHSLGHDRLAVCQLPAGHIGMHCQDWHDGNKHEWAEEEPS